VSKYFWGSSTVRSHVFRATTPTFFKRAVSIISIKQKQSCLRNGNCKSAPSCKSLLCTTRRFVPSSVSFPPPSPLGQPYDYGVLHISLCNTVYDPNPTNVSSSARPSPFKLNNHRPLTHHLIYASTACLLVPSSHKLTKIFLSQTLTTLHNLTASLFGVGAGILGLESYSGFIFYLIFSLLTSALVYAFRVRPGLVQDGNGGVDRYFGGSMELWTGGLLEGLSGFVLTWTLFYGLVRA
jgi:hypothetical protein